ncbi:MBL fold metallo-hydrolase [Roseateles violae]|uniref:MBL fold metallo-hydrolase n=1 Tax=Roseateles violae TaxID=3058042 RepID=A0ABT8DSW1_9BURK|nr:MBL fold metallo-hydrolase [Pelomonas sp. PFR6]MDN3919394.1 MBL fold metallo-hydrolase [Pelomonas sp. PFR6]
MKHLKRLIRLTALFGAVSAAALSSAQQTQADLHMEATRLNTGDIAQMTFPWRAFYCNLADNNNQLIINERTKNSIRVPLTKIYDDIWYIGSEYVGQYLVRTDTGWVMVDGGNNSAEMLNYNIPALQSLGMGPAAPLHGVLVTHGHGDHDGGAAQMKASTGAPIYLGSGDANNKSYAPIPLDSTATAPFDLQVGGRTFTVLPTPGHTAGATGFVVRGHDGGKEVKLFVAGGSSLPGSLTGIANYLTSSERTYNMIKALKVDATSNPHISWDGSRDRIKQIQTEGLSSPSQFTIGNELLLRGFAIVRECTATRLAQLDPTFSAPVWRVSQIEFMPGSPSTSQISAKLKNGWGPMADRTVTFSLDGSGAACTATTDAEGVATCSSRFGPFRPRVDTITATFAGGTSPGIVDLGAERTAKVSSGCSDLAHAKSIPPGQNCKP